MRILVTGAAGSIGTALIPHLADHEVLATDIDDLDVQNPFEVLERVEEFKPDVIYHLAADKHAPDGEDNPLHTLDVNAVGTANVLCAARHAKVILASTCKACDPETAYGASKLIAERMVLNAGGVVVRYFNVRETSGNVFRLWESLPLREPIPYTDCERYFISLDEAVSLTLRALTLPSGRYTVDPGSAYSMADLARDLYPGRRYVEVPRRRGDRRREPLCAESETFRSYRGLIRVESPHDPVSKRIAA